MIGTVVVTGATGFLGSHLVQALVDDDVSVVAVARNLGWRPTVRKLVSEGRVRHVPMPHDDDSDSERELREVLDSAAALVHLNHQVSSETSFPALAQHELDQNVKATLRVLALVPPTLRHLCIASSTVVYGPVPANPVSERHCPAPSSPYAAGKVAIEGLTRAWSSWSGIGISILRFSTIYGPMETAPRAVPNFCRAVLRGRPPAVDGVGTDVRDYIHVRDAAKAVILALVRAQPGQAVFNVGTGAGCSTLDLAVRIARLAGLDKGPVLSGTRGRPGTLVCDIGKARRELGYVPKVDLDGGLIEELRWFISSGLVDGVDPGIVRHLEPWSSPVPD